MTPPNVILAPNWRSMDELFSDAEFARLKDMATLIWAEDAPIPQDILQTALPKAEVLIAAEPVVTRETLDSAPRLKAVIEVSGAFPSTVDYAACFERGIHVLSCAPGFREAVAEMALGMTIAGGRGLVAQHDAFRRGEEHWLSDRTGEDFTLFGQALGFIGFGQIARETLRLMAPFRPDVKVYDPWLPEDVAAAHGVALGTLDEVLSHSRCLHIAATPTAENRAMIGADELARLPDAALVVLISRAHLVDFDALLAEVETGRIRAAIDVFPSEPVAPDHALRQMPGLILSPHRAAAVEGGRHLIGRLICDDLKRIFRGDRPEGLLLADPGKVALLAGVGDAAQVAAMADAR